jgi:DNA-binding CsgD family transcriptional regulator/catechol 2,3-dioxygenase-like lactoylglutathione lyase family enzyme
MTTRRGRPPHDDILTPAEWAIADAVRHGMSNRAIAERRGISPDAVKFHLRNILGKLGLERRAELRLLVAIPRTSALHTRGSAQMTQSDAKIGGLGQISRMVRDIEAARRFYGEVLGLPHLYSFPDMAFFDLGGTRLYLHQKDDAGAESVLYLRVSDIVATHAALVERGASFTGAPHMVHRHADGTEEWLAFFSDPEGRPLALMMQASPGES